MCLQYNYFENTVEKGEIARTEQFLHFPVFSTNDNNDNLSFISLFCYNINIYPFLCVCFQCRDIHKVKKADRCTFVKTTDDCQVDEGFISYSYFVYCDFSTKLLPLGCVCLVSVQL